MKRFFLAAALLFVGACTASAQYPNYSHRNYGYSQTYNPYYGYSAGYRGNYYGNSAPYQGNFRFAPGSGYGSIYGNGGHPGFNSYYGPAWNHPAAWGR